MANSARNILFIINDGPYGSERPYDALRLGAQTCIYRLKTGPDFHFTLSKMTIKSPLAQRG
jgi:hypothetical protein